METHVYNIRIFSVYSNKFVFQPFGQNETQATIMEKDTILNATELHFPDKPSVSDEAKVKHVYTHFKTGQTFIDINFYKLLGMGQFVFFYFKILGYYYYVLIYYPI